MNDYSFEEYADIIFMYGRSDGNCFEARRLYEQRYPNRVLPNAKTFQEVFRRLGETGENMLYETEYVTDVVIITYRSEKCFIMLRVIFFCE